jgi:hypothetical protein
MTELLLLLVSLCFAEFIHNLIEIWGMRQKVDWLKLSLDGKEHGRWPANINTNFKTVLLHIFILLLSGGSAFLVLQLLNFNNESLIFIGIMILFINYVSTTWLIDKFHREIGRLIKSAKTKGK